MGIPKEIFRGETRVALIPKMVAQLKKEDLEILIESDAGKDAFFTNAEYEQAGAKIITDTESIYAEADSILKIQPPQKNQPTGKHEIEMMKPGSMYIGFLDPFRNPDSVQQMNEKKITSFAMEFIPRIARAQNMDALSSMASIAGYRAVLMAAQYLGKFFPLLMTAAGTVPPAKVLVLGAGVAGLQAIATARRLGAKVEAFDVRPAAKEQVESLGAQFINRDLVQDAETAGGYAKEMSDEILREEREIIGARLFHSDVVITTAQTFGKKAPVLITGDMVKHMRKGSVIVDLAAEQGGNCELTVAGEIITSYDVRICGLTNLPATIPIDASTLYSRNITNFFTYVYQTKNAPPDLEDEIIKSTCITYKGNIINARVKQYLERELSV
ncbi:MAG: Re/Si-specific NAD(P)(+) transhydrogenase subunit alpha [wastewater metagenome]|nr:Re/Si-specific NAD(P)(+) transhydrogenase subunit alpha [Candidatus Loosdrechtia aerotolerans]